MKKRHLRKEIAKQNLLEKGGKQKQIIPVVQHEENITNTAVQNEENANNPTCSQQTYACNCSCKNPALQRRKNSIILGLLESIVVGFIVISIWNVLHGKDSWIESLGLLVIYCIIILYKRDGIVPFANMIRRIRFFLKGNIFTIVRILSIIVFLTIFSIFILR